MTNQSIITLAPQQNAFDSIKFIKEFGGTGILLAVECSLGKTYDDFHEIADKQIDLLVEAAEAAEIHHLWNPASFLGFYPGARQIFDEVRDRAKNPFYKWGSTFDQFVKEASKGSGQSDVLFQRRFNSLVDARLELMKIESPDQCSDFLEAARNQGYLTLDEQVAEEYEEFGPDDCSLTGIDTNCCPCGRHP